MIEGVSRATADAGYPDNTKDRDRWIIGQRPSRNTLDPFVPVAFFNEEEPIQDSQTATVSTILLTNRECPWKCLMCDLWRNTLEEATPEGAILAQIEYALGKLPQASQIKLYNSGSFFDSGAIPPGDLPGIAQRISKYERVIVECHPKLVGERCAAFAARIDGKLEVAMGLETANEAVLGKLNKRMTLSDFSSAAGFLVANGMDVRVFVIVKPPFVLSEADAVVDAVQSVKFAIECGARVVSLIPARGGNGAMEHLARNGLFAPPQLRTLEQALSHSLSIGRGRVLADLWDVQRFSRCAHCADARIRTLEAMNLTQRPLPGIRCAQCSSNQ